MKTSVYPRILLAALLLAGCAKADDTPRPMPPVTPPPPAAAGVYTDASGATFPITGLTAKTSLAVLSGPGSGLRISLSGSLADGRAVLVGFTVLHSPLPTAPGPLVMADKSREPYFIRVALPTDTTPAFGAIGVSFGQVSMESAGVIAGDYSGPLRAQPGTSQTGAPLVKVTFARVPVQP